MSRSTMFLAALAVPLTFMLSACGGGGGGGTELSSPGDGSPSPMSPVGERPALRDVSLINVEAAYARGQTGEGITIGHYEQLIDKTDPDLAGQLVGSDYDEIEPGTYSNAFVTIDEARQHATRVAKIAVGKRDGRRVHGIAYNAKLNFVALNNAEFNRLVAEQQEQGVSTRDITGSVARAINYLNSQTPIAFNVHGTFADYSTRTPESTENSVFNQGTVSALRQTATPASSRTIWVFGAANQSKAYPTGPGYYPVHFPELAGHVIAAVAVDEDGVIASYSNRCGDAYATCIAVPGTYRGETRSDGFTPTSSGTSYAAPTVAASLALLKQAFPTIGNDEIVARLYATANKSGRYSDRSIYGQGLVDLDAATRPAGEMKLMTTGSVNGSSYPVTSSSFSSSQPFGDALTMGFRGREVMVLDQFNAPFSSDLSMFEFGHQVTNVNHQHLENLLSRLQQGASQHSHSLISEWLQLAGEDMHFDTVSMALSEHERMAFSKSVPLFSKKQAHPVLTFGLLHEPESTLGASGKGAFGQHRSRSIAADFSREQQWFGWQTEISVAASLTSVDSGDGFIQHADPVIASSFSLEALKKVDRSTIRLSLSQPLRVETGRAKVHYPSARTPDRQVIYETFETDLAPSGRQVDVELSAAQSLSPFTKLAFSLWTTHDPGHVDQVDSISGVSLGLASRF